MTEIKTIWIIGLSGAGKTTLARLVIKRLQESGHPCVIIDGSEARDLFENKLGFDPDSRRKQTGRIKNLALWAIGQKIIPVVALIHPFEDDRDRLARLDLSARPARKKVLVGTRRTVSSLVFPCPISRHAAPP